MKINVGDLVEVINNPNDTDYQRGQVFNGLLFHVYKITKSDDGEDLYHYLPEIGMEYTFSYYEDEIKKVEDNESE